MGTKGSTDPDRGIFFEQLDDLVVKNRNRTRGQKVKSRLIVAGDFNCKIGEDSLGVDQMTRTLPNSESDSGGTSPNGWATLSLCTKQNLLVANFHSIQERDTRVRQ